MGLKIAGGRVFVCVCNGNGLWLPGKVRNRLKGG